MSFHKEQHAHKHYHSFFCCKSLFLIRMQGHSQLVVEGVCIVVQASCLFYNFSDFIGVIVKLTIRYYMKLIQHDRRQYFSKRWFIVRVNNVGISNIPAELVMRNEAAGGCFHLRVCMCELQSKEGLYNATGTGTHCCPISSAAKYWLASFSSF